MGTLLKYEFRRSRVIFLGIIGVTLLVELLYLVGWCFKLETPLLLGIIGGLSVAGLSVGATAVYHVSRRGNAPLPSGRGPIQTPSLPKFHRKEKRERDQWEK